MNNFKLLSIAPILAVTIISPVFAQAAFSEPAAFQAMNPNRDVLNGGALTPAARMGLDLAGGAYAYAPVNRISAKHSGDRPHLARPNQRVGALIARKPSIKRLSYHPT